MYVVLAKLFAAAAGSPARGLALLSACAQALLPLPLFVVFRRLGAERRIAAAATALTLLNPVVWMNGVRPMSDSVGLLFAAGAQAILLRAASGGRGLRAGSAIAGLAAGVRVQTLALTIPVWALALWRAPRRRAVAVALFLAAGLVWAVPTLIEAGGAAAYWRALRGTADDAAEVEPLVLTWTLNRAVRAARHVAFRPWGPEWLGVAMAALAAIGVVAAWRRKWPLLPILLAFGPYFVAHALFQQAHTQRYSMPYMPLLALLAVLGCDALSRLAPSPVARSAFVVLAAAAGAACGAVALPGLVAYAGGPPVQAALREAESIRSPAHVMTGHYMYDRYFALGPAGTPVLRLPPRREMAGLQESWLAGDDRPRLFLGEPRRTDLLAVDARAQRFLGTWAWPPEADVLLSGERPGAVDLVEIRPPSWFAGRGWGLSLEMAPPAGDMEPVRRAWLRATAGRGVLLFAGEPTDPRAGELDCELTLGDRAIDRRPCGAPWLAAYEIDASGGRGYQPLVFTTRRGSEPAPAPFALRGLAFGDAGSALVAHGDGWHYAETDEKGDAFRWATRMARTMAHVPADGARLVVEGDVPARYVAGPVSITLDAGGASRSVASGGPFRLEMDLPPGPPREVVLRADRDYVPDAVQRNGDRRRLALRIHRFEIGAAR